MDGASAWRRFWHITLPGLKHVIIVTTLLTFILTINDFNIIYVMTRGGPGTATQVFATYSYEVAFNAAALGPRRDRSRSSWSRCWSRASRWSAAISLRERTRHEGVEGRHDRGPRGFCLLVILVPFWWIASMSFKTYEQIQFAQQHLRAQAPVHLGELHRPLARRRASRSGSATAPSPPWW